MIHSCFLRSVLFYIFGAQIRIVVGQETGIKALLVLLLQTLLRVNSGVVVLDWGWISSGVSSVSYSFTCLITIDSHVFTSRMLH